MKKKAAALITILCMLMCSHAMAMQDSSMLLTLSMTEDALRCTAVQTGVITIP